MHAAQHGHNYWTQNEHQNGHNMDAINMGTACMDVSGVICNQFGVVLCPVIPVLELMGKHVYDAHYQS